MFMSRVTITVTGKMRSGRSATVGGTAIKTCYDHALVCNGKNLVSIECSTILRKQDVSYRFKFDIYVGAEYRTHPVIDMAKPVIQIAVSR
jgi:hypothetical protein